MEYRIEKLLEGLEIQRSNLVGCITDLNENLPNYGIKINDLNTQIMNIDNQTRDLVYALKDIKMLELNNDLTIKTQK